MDRLTWSHFAAFFQAVHHRPPFPWQTRLAKRVCESGWPDAIDLPTASGKTACLDVAVFAMAVRSSGPRRVFFVVDRRVVVDAAFERMQTIAGALGAAKEGVLQSVAASLCEMAGGEEPLTTYQMRGGIYRDDSWVRSPRQPALIASTVDQTGSRLLFRGYGVSDKTLPIHASLVGNDSLILLDEAHCSQPFAETLGAVRRYQGRGWAAEDLGVPFAFVEMTATPALQTDDRLELTEDDHAHEVLRKRLYAPKPVRLMPTKARLTDFRKLAECLVDGAEELAAKPGLRRIAIMVNRVQTARLAWEILGTRARRRHLLIGRMRPIDRLHLHSELQAMISGEPRKSDGEPVFVVATQCLEVGADLDFDAVVTECASIDALQQRFGRLDRIGGLTESGGTAEGIVMIAGPMSDEKYRDPIYGKALSKTWNWLKEVGDTVDFGICSEAGDRTVRERLKLAGDKAAEFRRESTHAPALLPAHLDALVQTSPRPAIEPDVSLFLHGEESGPSDVQVIWRADLDLDNQDSWAEIVAMCPPVSMESMPVPYRAFLAWLSQIEDDTPSADIEGIREEERSSGRQAGIRCPVLRWRGDESRLVKAADDIMPGDTLVLSAVSEGWNELGHVPQAAENNAAEIDVAERARRELRRGWILRLHPSVLKCWPENSARQRLIELASEPTLTPEDAIPALQAYRDAGITEWPAELLRAIPKRLDLEAYPPRQGVTDGWTISSPFVEADAGGDESSAASPVRLDRHLKDVAEEVRKYAAAVLADGPVRLSVERAAELHDYGKADARFQALLRGGDPMAAQFAPVLLAKGTQSREGKSARTAQWARSGLPDGFRHELVSLLLAQTHPDAAGDELALHLIASHHGRCRPFAPVVDDSGGPLVYQGLRIDAARRIEGAAHRLENGVADRFWRLTRQYGWWGLPYLESLLRLGDACQSAGRRREGEGGDGMSDVIFRGIDGSNPLGFLAALGAFRVLDLIWPGEGVRMRWIRDGAWRPEVSGVTKGGEAEICQTLLECAYWSPLEAFEGLGSNLTVSRTVFENVVREVAKDTTAADRRAADFAAAFGCDVLDNKEKDRIVHTDLCFITGSGHQDFLGTARDLARKSAVEHLREALFGPWKHADPKLSMRWDPTDAREYALRWGDPSVGGVSSVWGANRLAFEAVPMFPVQPTESGARTTGFCTRNGAHEFTWPIWSGRVGLNTARSLIVSKDLEQEKPDRAALGAIGVAEIFRAQRVRIGQGANFKVSFRPARAA